MKTLIKKEIRLLLPAWITAMLLAIVPGVFNIAWEFSTSDSSVFIFVQLIFAAGVLFLGINSFGEELNYNTFSVMLAQPMKRPRIWLVKVVTLATAFVSVWLTGILLASWQSGVLRLLWHPHYPWVHLHPEFSGAFEFITLATLVAFSGGLWTTLLLRQIAGAFWFTLLTPLAIVLGISAVFQDWIVLGKSINTFIVAALVLYSVAGFLLAWRLFMRAQDVQWTGGEISLPHYQRTSELRAGARAPRPRHWLSALAWKELQLHQGAFLIAAIILVLHLTAYFIRMFHPHTQNPDLQFVFEAIWTLWLMMPLLIGAAAIAEERRMGTLEPQLCLPASRGKQLFVKFCMALVLSLIFGALMPLVIERNNLLDYWQRIFLIAAGIFLVSFYASSLARTTLQAIGWAILLALVIYNAVLFPASSGPQFAYYGNSELALLKQHLDAAILPIVLGWLTFSNFRHLNQNWKFWLRNFLAILAAFVCAIVVADLICFLRELGRRGVY
jgi:ABC-type transport system involved in multi-copper enzyme maturation permease subunit